MLDYVANSELVEMALSREYQRVADMSAADIAQFPERQRFRTIAAIQDSVKARDTAPPDDPTKPVCEESFATEIAAMVKISETMRHTAAYSRWLDACFALLVYNLSQNKNFMRFTSKWDKRDISLRKHAHTTRTRLHVRAANKTFAPIFQQVSTSFCQRPPREDPDPARRTIINGQLVRDYDTGSHHVELNTHPKSSFSAVAKSHGTGHHELVHALGFQKGVLYKRGEYERLGTLCHDGMLWHALMAESAVISTRIKPAYRAQFHEVVAFAEGDKMAAAISRILKPAYVPVRPM